ncbi:M1 family metallopeptidase [Candidatus Saccharibacteria bacterium]|nr:M1 family metallopeptidase [Candidatus Saccharibacteria bacterium]
MERLIDYFVPEWYGLDLVIDKKAKTISGTAKIRGEVLSETIKFHAVKMEIERVLVDGHEADYRYDDDFLTMPKMRRGNVEVIIYYSRALNENMQGAYLSTYELDGRTETIVATQFESHYAREAFPCIDEPAAKAVFELTLTTAADDTVISNMPEIALCGSDSGMKTVAFEPTPRMSTYLLAWVSGKFHGKTVTNAHGTKITTYCALNQDVDAVDFANEVAAKALEFYDDNFGVPYPLTKCDQVALPDFEAGAMENWGLVTYRESMMLAGESATLDTKKSVALTVAHELSHQWFGDLVTMQWWDDLWLNESFASVMEYFAVDAAYPEFKIFENFFTGDALAALKRDSLAGVQSVHQEVNDPEEIATLFDPAIVYAKGARLMLMVVRLMGWEKFCAGLRGYFETHKYSNTVGDDLWAALGKHAGFDVGEMMHGFIDRPGYPVIRGDDDFEKFTQRRFVLDGEMTESDWMLPEISEDMSGHYILQLTDAQFEERLGRFDKLGLEEKLRLLIDRDLLAKAGLVSSASLLPLIEKFRDEESAAVWSIIVTIVAGMKVFFDPGSADERKFKDFVRKLVEPGLARVGLVTREDDDENTIRLRATLLALDFYGSTYEGADVTNMRKLAKMYDGDYAALDAEIRSSILDAKLYLEPGCLDEYLNGYQMIADPEIKFDLLFAMTLMRDEAGLARVMELLECPDVVKPQDQFHLFIYLYRNPAVKMKVFLWLTSHWDFVKQMAGDKSLDNYPRYTAGSVRTADEYDAWRKFFEPMAGDVALARAIEVGKGEIEARLALIERDRAAVMAAVEGGAA